MMASGRGRRGVLRRFLEEVPSHRCERKKCVVEVEDVAADLLVRAGDGTEHDLRVAVALVPRIAGADGLVRTASGEGPWRREPRAALQTHFALVRVRPAEGVRSIRTVLAVLGLHPHL